MPELKFETGLVTYTLNGACKVTFNPTDLAFAERICNVFDALDEKQKAYEKEKDMADERELFDTRRKYDAEMRAMIDDVFGTPVCDALFGKMDVYAFGDGLPAWCNLLLAVMDEIQIKFEQEQKLTNPRIAKYTSKYHK